MIFMKNFKFKPVIILLMAVFSPTYAATDLADVPLAAGLSNSTAIKPNIAMVIDDSGSMDYDYIPDGISGDRDHKCFGYHLYNGMAYNPALTYKPPYSPSGSTYSDGITRYPDAVFSAAKYNGYDTNSDTTDLTNLRPTNGNSGYYYGYYSAGSGWNTSYYYYYYTTSTTTSTGCESNSSYTAITNADNITAPSGINAKTNYANWYAYYRKRVYMSKASVAEAFSSLEDKYRIGLFFLNGDNSGSSSQNSGNDELAITDFSGANRTSWFNNLFSSVASGATPTRGALSRMGRMYAGKISGWDPVQYSCQRNFSIISSDGYWNTGYETSSYGPKKIDNSTNVGNQDSGGTPAVSAIASITISDNTGNKNNGCYQITSISVGTIELLNSSPIPSQCTTSRKTIGSAIASSINAKNATTGYSANYSNGVVSITAPSSAGNLTSTPNVVVSKSSGNNTLSFSASGFSGYAAATEGISAPYKDNLNISDTLADIAYYYYNTDLRTEDNGNCSNTIGGTTYTGLCVNNVFQSEKDKNPKQHMTTYTIGLGLSGEVLYQENYETAANTSSLDYYDIVNSNADWPDPETDVTGGNTSIPARVDDLWHAAVNGHGKYYSTRDPNSLAAALKKSLTAINETIGSSSAAATSSLEPVAGDNYIYVALYRTAKWDGDVKAYTIDPVSGVISSSAVWSAQTKLDTTISSANSGSDGRIIKYFNSSATNKLKEFTYTNISADSLGSYFTSKCSGNILSQCTNGTITDSAMKTAADSGTNMVNFLRGQKTYEMSSSTDTNQLYRERDHALGDIVNAMPVYVKAPSFTYGKFDATYTTFQSNNSARAGTVYAAANDGMLHAFNADDGTERWAYVPRFVMPNMYKLADADYGNNHTYFVDGSPTAADICINPTTITESSPSSSCSSSSDWRTIVVGGLNKGGRGLYALDVTDPTNPKGLWEFSETDMGYTFGNPIVTRRKDGKWVVIVSSGYNNVSNGDGKGHLYVINAYTGALLEKISTTAGSTSYPSGLAKLNAWIDNAALNTASVVYGGDLLGNLWRFDFDDNYSPSGNEAVLLANFSASGTPQPITVKPELAEVEYANVKHHVVMVGTGKYLGVSDPSDTQLQSIYSVSDNLYSSTGIGDARTSNLMVNRAITTDDSGDSIIRTVTGDEMNWTTKRGWYLDLADTGERVNVDMQLQYNILTVATNVPSTDVCTSGGYAWFYNIDINTGKHLTTATDDAIAIKLTNNALVAGIKKVKLTTGKTVTIFTDTRGNITVESDPSATSGTGTARRTMWRELFD